MPFAFAVEVCEPDPAVSPGTVSPSGPPNFQAAMTSAVTTAIANSATTAIRDSRGPRSRRGIGARRARNGASSSPTVKRELYSSTNGWPSRPSASAYERRKPRTYVGAGRMSKRSSSSARRYFGRIFVRSSSSGKSMLLTETGLAEAGADVEHERGIVDGLASKRSARESRRTRAGRTRRARRAPTPPCRARRCRGRGPTSATDLRRLRARRTNGAATCARARIAASPSPAATGMANAACRRS